MENNDSFQTPFGSPDDYDRSNVNTANFGEEEESRNIISRFKFKEHD
jgi:hypothetical protein